MCRIISRWKNLDEKEKKNIYYVIDKRSDEYKNVEKYGKHVIDFMSVKHMLYIMSMLICISSDSKSHLYAWRTKPSLVKRAIGKKKLRRMLYQRHQRQLCPHRSSSH